jgi:hypothetical protein
MSEANCTFRVPLMFRGMVDQSGALRAETVFDRCNSLPLIVRFATLRKTHVLLGDGRAGSGRAV